MTDLATAALEAYLKDAFGPDAVLLHVGRIGRPEEQGMKALGYGKPLLVRFWTGGLEREAVLSTMRGDKYGHQFYWDRAAILLFQYETSAALERHVKPLGVGYVNARGGLTPLREPVEFFILNEKLEGHDYFKDLERIRGGDFRPSDETLAREFARWLARIHAAGKHDPDLYYRAVRNLIGSDECIMGLIDEAFPHPYPDFPEQRFLDMEKRVIDWRWKLKRYSHRLRAVHGDFHPWNVLVDDAGGFRVLDRSRGEWGEPAGDVCTMAMNYLLFGLYNEPRLTGAFERLYRVYFEEYLSLTNDHEALEVMAPFFVFRGLVVASPEWYPNHPPTVRRGLLRFLLNVLEDEVFDWEHVNRYME
ncbi:phosphotransferase [Desulfovibrio aminophilus]|uniref:aminoglycoside phosphotransferase family protein n=1 Tax=Desulfovibrio aminophilus TaxID=81425 RepID=UPI003399EEE6